MTPIDRAAQDTDPIIPASTSLPEITIKAVLLSIVLSAVLASANAYLGLFAGMTVSASIPAAVISFAILRMFRHSNILENNIVQTAASAGEALAAGIIFTIPALVIIQYWVVFDYWHTTAIAIVGGLLGVLFTIPLRRALILKARLTFPEGVATAEVLKIGSRVSESQDSSVYNSKEGFGFLLTGGLLGGAAKLGESGLRLWTDALEGATTLGKSVWYLGINLSPALIAVGFIVGLPTALVIFLGGAIGWLFLLPLYAIVTGTAVGQAPLESAMALWSEHIRFVGIGGMLVGGLWTIAQLRGPVWNSLRDLLAAYRLSNQSEDGHDSRRRTDRDAGLFWIMLLFLLSTMGMIGLYYQVIQLTSIALLMTGIMIIAAFLFSAVAAYMSGLVGSSSNPVSGMTIATIMLSALLLLLFLGQGHPAGPAAAILIGAVVCCAAAMGGDNLQDLKTGQLVGATPWKQQIMQVIGVVSGAIVLAPVLALLNAKYGIGVVTSTHPQPLTAPQATLMAGLAQGVFGEGLPWHLVGIGGLLSMLVIWVDQRQAAKGSEFRFPVLAVALGIYLPLKLSAAILVGGIIAALVKRKKERDGLSEGNNGLLTAAGLVTGEALMGIVLALPIALANMWPTLGTDPLRLFETPPLGPWLGVMMLVGIGGFLYHAARK